MAADVNLRPTSSKADAGDYGKAFVLTADVDFTVTANQLAQNETMALFDIPADTAVENAVIEVVTADADVTDVNLGMSADGSTDDTLIDGATLATTGYKRGGANADLGQVTAAAMQLVLTNIDADTINEAVIKVIVVCRSLA